MRARLLRGDGRESQSRREDFDPAVEGRRYGLAPEVSAIVWEQARREATDHSGMCDEALARERFAQLAELFARSGGQLGPKPFHWTQLDASSGSPAGGNLLAGRAPGRTTQVLAAASARVRVALGEVPGQTTLTANQADADVGSPEESRGVFRRYVSGGHAARAKLEAAIAARDHCSAVVATHALKQDLASARRHLANGLEGDEVLRAELAALEGPAERLLANLPNMSAGGPRELWGPDSAEWRAMIDGAADRAANAPRADGLPPAARVEEPRVPVRLPASLQGRMERVFGRRFDDVELHRDSAEVPAGRRAITRGRHIHIERGAVDLTATRDELVLAHELAHVVQQDGRAKRTGTRQELEREAAWAATRALRGQTAHISLRAEPTAVYAFSEDHEHGGDNGPEGVDDVAAALGSDAAPSSLPSGAALDGAEIPDGALGPAPHGDAPSHGDAHGTELHGHHDSHGRGESRGAQSHDHASRSGGAVGGDVHGAGNAHRPDAAARAGAGANPGQHGAAGARASHAAASAGAGAGAATHGDTAHGDASHPHLPSGGAGASPGAHEQQAGGNASPGPSASTPRSSDSARVRPQVNRRPGSERDPGHTHPKIAPTRAAAPRHEPPTASAGHAAALRMAMRPKAPPPRLPHHTPLARPSRAPMTPAPRAATMMPAIPGAGPSTATPRIADAVARLRSSLADAMGIAGTAVRFTESPAPDVNVKPPEIVSTANSAATGDATMPNSTDAAAASPGPRPDPNAAAERAARRRAQARQLVDELMRRGAQRVQGVAGLGATVAQRVQPALDAAHTTIAARVAQSEGIIRAGVEAARTRITSTAVQARGTIASSHQQSTAAVHTATAAARATAASGYATALVATLAREQQEIGHIQQIYTEYDPRYRAVGPRVGREANAHAAQRAATWRSQFNGESDFWDGPLHDNRLRARADAATAVGDAYRSGLTDEANKQADAARAGQAKDIDTVQAAGRQVREQLGQTHTRSQEALAAGERQALEAAQHTVDAILAALEQQADGTLHALVDQQTTLLHGVRRTGQSQRRAIDDAGRGAVASLQQSLAAAAGGLRQTLAELHAQLDGQPAPDPRTLAGTLRQVGAQLDDSAARAVASADRGAASAIQDTSAQAAHAAQGLAEAGHAGAEAATAAGAGFVQNATGTQASAQAAFSQLATGHRTTSANAASSAAQAFTQQVAGMATMFEQLERSLRGGFDQSLRGLEDGLRGALGKLDPDIDREADKAAAQVQPRWKSVLKVVLAIAIVLVVAIVVGPAVVGFVGAAAGALGASAGAASVIGAMVGGAIVGAGTGAVNQMGNNLIDNRPVMEGVGHAAIMGAVTGAIGGGAGAWGSALSRGGSALAGLAVRVGGNMVGAFGGQVAADVATGRKIDWRAAATGAAVAGVFSLGAEGLGALSRGGAAGRFGRLGAFADHVGDTVGKWQRTAGGYGARAGGFVGSRIRMGIDSIRGAFGYEGSSSVNRLGPQPGGVDLTDAQGRQHILEGEGTPGEGRGRHAYGGGEPSDFRGDGRFKPKSEFPPDWSNERILTNASDIATDPAAYAKPNNPTNPASGGNRVFYGIRDGVLMQVVVNPTGRIVTAYPVNQATVRVPGGPPGVTMVITSPTPVRANPPLPSHPILPPPTQGGDEHRDLFESSP